MRFKIVSFFLFLSILVASSGCNSGFSKREPLLQGYNVALFQLDADDYPASDLQEMLSPSEKFPALTPEQLRMVLSKLRFQRLDIWGTVERDVFYEEELKIITPILAEALPMVEPGHRLVLISRYDQDRAVISRMERVTAVIWLDKAGLNVILGEIREAIPNHDRMVQDDWTEIFPVSFRRAYPDLYLLPPTSSVFHLKKMKNMVHRTWAVFDLESLKEAEGLPEDDDSLFDDDDDESPPSEVGESDDDLLDDDIIVE